MSLIGCFYKMILDLRDSGMSKVMKSFICGGYICPVARVGRAGVDVDVKADRELVDGFCCCCCDMLGVDGVADVAVWAEVWVGWNKFRPLMPLLTSKSLMVSGRLCGSCVRCSVLHGGGLACQKRK